MISGEISQYFFRPYAVRALKNNVLKILIAPARGRATNSFFAPTRCVRQKGFRDLFWCCAPA